MRLAYGAAGAQIPNPTITSRLDGLYTGATHGLLTGIAMVESSYKQFASQTRMGLAGSWPLGNGANNYTPADTNVGLMQVPNGMTTGFDWYTVSVKAGAFGGCNLASSGVAGLC